MPTVVLALADTRSNRRAVRAAESLLRATFPLGSDAVLSALRSGRVPAAWGIVFIASRTAGLGPGPGLGLGPVPGVGDSRAARAGDRAGSPAAGDSRGTEAS